MTVPDRICGLEVVSFGRPRYRSHECGDHWSIRIDNGLIVAWAFQSRKGCKTVDDAVAFLTESILAYAAECRAFADKVLGERG